MPEPSKIPEAWAVAGDYNAIPTADPGNGLASWDYGFPVETQTPLAAGGVPPRRQDINGALYWLSTAQLWYQQGGLWQYDATENYEIGNVVEQNNAMYYCKAANGPGGTVKSPSADTAGTYWKKLVNADGTLNVPVINNASTTVKGIVELATSAETKALTDATRAVTPDSLNGLLSLSPAALTVPKADSSGKLTGWINALKDSDGRVNISIKGTAPTLQTARTVRVALGSTSAASFDGSTNITPGVSGTLPVGNGGTGQTNLDLVTVGKAKALNTARTVRTNLASTATASFDGTANIVPGVTGVLPITNGGTGSATKNFVDLTTQQVITAQKTIKGNNVAWSVINDTHRMDFEIGTGGTNRGIYDAYFGTWLFYASASDVYFKGLADRAVKLETARSVRTDLASSSIVSFDGTTNITPGVTGILPVANGGTGQNSLDLVTVGKAKALNTARSVRTNLASTLAVNFDGTANITPGVTGTLAVTNGGTGQTNLDDVTVGKAKALNTARTINGTDFDGTAPITTAQWGTARNITVQDADGTNSAAAVSVNGGANVTLKLPATIKATLSGNASTATKLETTRTINGTNFNGTANITTAQWGKSRNVTIKDATQSHTGAKTVVDGSANFSLLLPATISAALNGNADTATQLATARTINGTPFDGTANITALESSARSFGQSGYIKFQSGLIVQWGRSNFNDAYYKDVDLPIQFTSAIYWAMGADYIVGSATSVGTHAVAWSAGASTRSTVRFLTGDTDANAFVWLAIGV